MRGLAASARLQGQYKAAIKHLERVLEISREMKEFTGERASKQDYCGSLQRGACQVVCSGRAPCFAVVSTGKGWWGGLQDQQKGWRAWQALELPRSLQSAALKVWRLTNPCVAAGDADAYGTIADCYTDMGDLEKAAVFYDKWVCMALAMMHALWLDSGPGAEDMSGAASVFSSCRFHCSFCCRCANLLTHSPGPSFLCRYIETMNTTPV